MAEEKLLKVSSNPHVRSKLTTSGIMLMVIIALMPATGFGVYHFGMRALMVIATCVGSAFATELIFGLFIKKNTVSDLSAIVTGLLLALNLPVSMPLWMAALGSVFAILVVKLLFGGLGQNFMNPALAARCFLLISFPAYMTDFAYDGFTGATPLAVIKGGENVDIWAMVIGKTAGTIGETSMVAILLGACFLILTGVIDLRIPGSYIVSFLVFVIVFGGHGFDPAYLSAQLAGGGLMLGAFFMATDWVTTPTTPKGEIIFAVGCGFFTFLLRYFGSLPEGVSLAILLMNMVTPTIDRYVKVKKFGYIKPEKKAKEAK